MELDSQVLEEVGPCFIEEVEESEDRTYSELSFCNNRYFTHFKGIHFTTIFALFTDNDNTPMNLDITETDSNATCTGRLRHESHPLRQ